jgi:hypothetical protein
MLSSAAWRNASSRFAASLNFHRSFGFLLSFPMGGSPRPSIGRFWRFVDYHVTDPMQRFIIIGADASRLATEEKYIPETMRTMARRDSRWEPRGVAMGSGTDIARESANIVLLEKDLSKFAETLQIGRRARGIGQTAMSLSVFAFACLLSAAPGCAEICETIVR